MTDNNDDNKPNSADGNHQARTKDSHDSNNIINDSVSSYGNFVQK